MTKNDFLDQLVARTNETVGDIILPVKLQASSEAQEYRAAEVYKMRLPDGTSATKKAPYIIHQIVTSTDSQPTGQNVQSSCTVRSVFCVYHDNEQEGALALLNLMERLRISFLRQPILSNRYHLDLRQSLETLLYVDDTAPYFAGEMKSVWRMPTVEREDTTVWQ